jgi:hypothetical protein
VIGGGTVIVIVAVAVLVPSVTEVAVTVTVFPLGTAAGAVYVTAVPLGVFDALKDPHAVLLPQVADHLTPALALSLATVAVSDAVAFTTRVEG